MEERKRFPKPGFALIKNEEMDDDMTSSEEESSDESDSATEIILFSDDEEEQHSSQRESARVGAIMEFKIDDQEEAAGGAKVEQIKKEVKQEELDSTKVTVKTETKAIEDKVELENPKENEEMEVEAQSSAEPISEKAVHEDESETK